MKGYCVSRPSILVLGSLWLLTAMMTTRATAVEQIVVVVLDDSGSMDRGMHTGERRINAAKQALSSVLQRLPYDTQFGILALNSKVNGSYWIVPIGAADVDRWQKPLNHVGAKGGTALGARMREGADELLRLRAKQPYATYRLLIVSDGEASDAPLLRSILPDLLSRGINLDVIGVDMKEDHSLAKTAHSYRRAGDRTALTAALADVFAESVYDSGTGQSDFEMLMGLPDDVASSIVKGLSVSKNDPLSVRRPDSTPPGFESPDGGVIPGSNRNLGSNPQRKGGTSIGGALVGSFCCCGFFVMAVFFFTTIIVRAVKNNTKS